MTNELTVELCEVCLNPSLGCLCAKPARPSGPPPYEYREDCPCVACKKYREVGVLASHVQSSLDKLEAEMNRHENTTGAGPISPPIASFPALPIDPAADKAVDAMLARARVPKTRIVTLPENVKWEGPGDPVLGKKKP